MNDKLFEHDYVLLAGEKEYLQEIIPDETYRQMFDGRISFLNKGRCGNGGTTGFVEYALKNNRGCLVLVPNRSIVLSKEEEYKNNPDICCIYGECDKFDMGARIVIATYDMFSRLLKSLEDYGFTRTEDIWQSKFWSRRTIIIDEYHKLVDECNFRDVCNKITELISKIDNGIVLMSATPHMGYIKMLRELTDCKRDIYRYDVKYEDKDPHRIQVYEAKRKDVKSILSKVMANPKNEQVCVFYNCAGGVGKLLQQIGDTNCEFLCSDKHKEEFGNYYADIFHPNKRLHFMTSGFFTGHDIKTHVNKCIIIGSKKREEMCLGERDIKQIIGRFRNGVDGIHIFYLQESTDRNNYQTVKSQYSKDMNLLSAMGDDWTMNVDSITTMQDSLHQQDTLERFGYWRNKKCLIERLRDYEYWVDDAKIGEFEQIEKRKKLTFSTAKRKVANGEAVSYDEYPYSVQIQEYMAEKGKDSMLMASRADILDWYNIRKTVGVNELDLLTPRELFKVIGLQPFGRYRASYLMACLNYVGAKCEYDELSFKMNDVFGCYACMWKVDDKGKDTGNIYIVFNEKKEICDFPPKMGIYSYSKETNNIPKLGGESHKISYQTEIRNRHCYGKTILLSNSHLYFSNLRVFYLYNWVNEDKANRLPDKKKTKDWLDIKNFKQTKISELYKDTDKEYLHQKASVDCIDCLIIDIDSGLRFSEFEQKYKRFHWFAYPTISNITEDWSKFRVIVPLERQLKLTGEYNVMALKMLRSMFCPYEDPCHQLPSYINSDDYDRRIVNEGEDYCVSQEVVDDIILSITNSKDMSLLKFDKTQVGKDVKTYGSQMSLDDAKTFFDASMSMEDGARHKRLFIIKNRLNAEDRTSFECWLSQTYGWHYVEHWRSHKVVNRH